MELMLCQPFQETSSLQVNDHTNWQTTMPAGDELESIIANSDPKVCSGLARRRLSSKKRKKPMDGGQEGEYAAVETSRSSHSPADRHSPIKDSNSYQSISHVRQPHHPPGYYQGGVHTLPAATVSGAVQVPPGGQYVNMAQGFSLMSGPSIGMLPKQFSNPVLSHIQQELNYRFIQDQSVCLGLPEAGGAQSSSPQQEQVHPSPCNHSGAKKPFKWCYAHVMVAKQIHQHQLQSKASSEQPLPRHRTGQATAALQQEHLQHPLQHLQHPQQHLKHPLQHLQHPQQHLQHPQQHLQHPQQHLQHPQQHLQHQLLQQQQQQLLLLQMYSGLPQSGVLPSYVALPYPTLQDLQLSYLPAQGMSLAPSSVPMVRPVPAVSTAADINMHLSGALQLAPSVTSLGPVPDMASVLPGASWIAPVPVFGSCIVNPFHPGILTTSWVK